MTLERRRTKNIEIPHTSGVPLSQKGLSIVHPYYNEPERFDIQFENWCNYDPEIKDKIKIVVADDGSEPPLHTLIGPKRSAMLDFNLSIYRAMVDLKHNTPGALNLGIENTDTEWVLIMDSDCLIDPITIKKLLKLRPDPWFFYVFDRNRISRDPTKAMHTRFLPCTILFRKEVYDIVGGFDEDLTGERSGGYGFFDNDFSTRLLEAGCWQGKVKDVIVTEYMEDMVGPNIQQKTNVIADVHHKINKSLWYKKIRGEVPVNREHIRFEWEKSFEHKREA